MTLVKNILRTSISSIAYLRYLFPEESFQDTQLAGLKIKSLARKSNPEVSALCDWMEQGVFDAIEKKYLKALVFSIFSEFNNPASLIESYTFKFTYPKDGTINMGLVAKAKGNKAKELPYMTREEIQQAWCTMIRTLIAISNTLPPLPTERHLAMRLYYYDDVTPNDYNPPGFEMADDAPNFEFIADPESLDIGGNITTKFHSVSLRLDTAIKNIPTENEIKKVEDLDEDTKLAIIAISECHEKSFNKEYIIKKIYPNNNMKSKSEKNSKVEYIMNQLIDLGLISKDETSKKSKNPIYQLEETESNKSLMNHIVSKYSIEEEN